MTPEGENMLYLAVKEDNTQIAVEILKTIKHDSDLLTRILTTPVEWVARLTVPIKAIMMQNLTIMKPPRFAALTEARRLRVAYR